MSLIAGGVTIPVLGADPVETPDAGKVFLYSVGTSFKMKLSSGAIVTFATGISTEDVQDIVGALLGAGSSKASVVYNDIANTLVIDVVEANIIHQNLSGAGTNTHAQIDSHIASTANPHSTTAAQLGVYTTAQTDNEIDLAVAAHEALVNPHPVYETSAEAQAKVDAHANLTNNPHATTKAQVGLGNADNTSDLNKPISTATQTALNLKYDASNPSGYETPAQLNTRDTNNRNRANHTGTQLSSTISDFAATVLSTVLTGFAIGANAAIGATDTVLQAFSKVQGQIDFINSVLQSLVLGDQFEEFTDLTVFTTASAANQVAATFTTASKPFGKYRIGLTWDWTFSATNNDAIFSVFVDGVLVSGEFRMETSETANQRYNNQWFYYSTFGTVQTHTIELRCRAETGGSTVTVNEVRAEIWRATP